MDAKKPFHEVVAEGLIEQLKQGTAPWIKPWKAGDGGGFMPFNPTTGKRYKGINAIHLMAQGRSDQRWLTYKQAAAVGGQVRKGEKSTPIQYWKFEEEQTKRDENNKPVLDGNGNPVKVRVRLERPKMFMANVFNAEQIDGLPDYQRPVQTWNALERAEQIFTASGAEVRHGGDSAYYSPSLDRIQMPSREQFGTADDYYRVKLHELGHWTGHPSRLDRDLSHPFGSEMYAKEELRAEIASMILGEELGLGHDPGQHVSYVQSWIKVLQNDPLEIFRAASDAEKIQGFVLGLEQEQIQTVAESQSITSQAQDEPVEQGAKMELPSAVKQPNKQAEDWSLAAVKRADLDQVTVRMTAAQLDTFEQTLNSMLPLDDSNEFWKSRPAAMDAFYADTSLFLPDEQIMSALDVVRDEQARRSRLEAPGEPVEIPTVTPASEDAAGQELSQARDLPELSQNHKMVATALRNVRSEPDPALKASFGNLLAVTSAEALGYELPSNWSGKVEVEGIARDSDGEGVHKVDADEVAEFYGLYVRDSEGLAVWLADYETLEQAQEQAESLLAVHDYVAAMMGADAPHAEQEFVVPPDEMTPEEMAESQAEERTYIQVPFKEKGQARELGGKWDGDKKSWYVPAGVDPQPFAKWLTGGDEVPTAGIPAAAQAKTQEQSVSPAKPSQTPAGDQADGRTYIQVPFKEKGQARELGGKWDRVRQSWYVPAGVDPQPFSKWFVGASAASQEASKEAQPDPANIPAAAPTQDPTREYLAVPFGEREAARAAGAAWDKVAKSWYVGPNGDAAALARWKIEEVRNSQEPAQRLEDEFADALRACGLVPGSYREKGVLVKHPVLDGQKHRIPVVGGRSGSRDGFYVAYTDGHPAGFIQNNKTGVSMNWKSKGYTLSDEEKAVLAAEAAVKTQAREAAQLKTHQEVAERVNASLATMVQAVMPTPYLQAKSIMPLPGVLTDQTFKQTVIPAMDTTGKVWTAQYIQKDGTKRFAKDGRKEGCFHPLGGLEAIAAAPALVIGEGYATARSLATVLGFGTVAAFDSGNLGAVVQALHEKFPDKPVVVAGDDDAHLVLTHGVNVGRAKAHEAAKAVGGKAIFPTFAPGEVVYPSELPPITPQAYRAHAAAKSDYEDMISKEGAEAEKSQRAADLKAVMLSDAQVAALSKMKRLTDFNDLQTKSSLGEDGLVRQVKNAVAKIIEDHQAHQQTQQRKQTQALAADDDQPRRSISR